MVVPVTREDVAGLELVGVNCRHGAGSRAAMEMDAVVMIMVSMVRERVGEDNRAGPWPSGGIIPTGVRDGRPLAALSDPGETGGGDRYGRRGAMRARATRCSVAAGASSTWHLLSTQRSRSDGPS